MKFPLPPLVLTCLVSTSVCATPVDVSFSTLQKITLTGKLYLPESPPGLAPAVVLLHGCSGMYSYSDPAKGVSLLIREWGERLAAAGYVALAVDSFSGRKMPQNQCGKSGVGVSEVSDRPYDAHGAAQFLKKSYSGWVDPNRMALIGWSHGGSSAMATLAAAMKDKLGTPFKLGFAFYPGCGLYNAFGGISGSTYVPSAPLHILHGGSDPLLTGGFCDKRVGNAVKLGSTDLKMTVYKGAQHAFDNARASEAKWTQADFEAKSKADAFVMKQLSSAFK